MKSQNDAILSHLRRSPITPLEAIQKYGCLRLGARIWDLKQSGHQIARDLIEVSNRHGEPCRVAQHYLVKEARA